MRTKDYNRNIDRNDTFERQDVLKQFMHHNSKTRFSKRNSEFNVNNYDKNFCFLNQVKLNKGKKFLLQQQRNTQIQRSNRILHQKLTRCARKSQPNALRTSQINSINSINLQKSRSRQRNNPKKLKTNPTLPTLQKESFDQYISRYKQKNPKTLFMGHSKIDQVEFKIKIIIAQTIYYLIAQNQHTKIVLQMPEQEYCFKKIRVIFLNTYQYKRVKLDFEQEKRIKRIKVLRREKIANLTSFLKVKQERTTFYLYQGWVCQKYNNKDCQKFDFQYFSFCHISTLIKREQLSICTKYLKKKIRNNCEIFIQVDMIDMYKRRSSSLRSRKMKVVYYQKDSNRISDMIPSTNDDEQYYLIQNIISTASQLLSQKQWHSAIMLCDKGLSIRQQAQLYNIKGRAQGKLGNIKQKIKLTKRAIQLNPNCAAYYRNLGIAFYKDEKFQDALLNHQKSVQLQKNNSINYHNAGVALYQLRKYPEAIQMFDISIQIEKYQAHSYRWLAKCYLQIGQKHKALQNYYKAYDLSDQIIDKKEIDKLQKCLYPWWVFLNKIFFC